MPSCRSSSASPSRWRGRGTHRCRRYRPRASRPSTSSASPSASTSGSRRSTRPSSSSSAGITDEADREWYASVMLNRLMFVYFIQRKGFLDGDRDYLRNRLEPHAKPSTGKDKFYSFYRYFLLRLFHEGLGGRKRASPSSKSSSATSRTSTAACSTCTNSKGPTATARHPDSRQGLRAHLRLLRSLPVASRRAPAARRQRDQPRCARLHLREVHQPEADGGVLHQGGHHRVHQQEHRHPVPLRRRAGQVQGRLRESQGPDRLGSA